jgi:peptidoglycan lytic transglycosylase
MLAVFALFEADTPSLAAMPPAQVGLASFYGPGFDGERAASGQIFNARAMVAAHRTLPFGSLVRVTNLENGRAVIVRIVDRGPYGRNQRRGTIIDVSTRAAERLRSVKKGLVPVRVEVLRRPLHCRDERGAAGLPGPGRIGRRLQPPRASAGLHR